MGTISILKKYFIALFVFILLACGGGGDSAPSAPSAPPAPNISVESTIDLGGVVLGNSVEQLIEMTNTGNQDLKIGQISQLNVPYEIVVNTDNCSNTTITPSKKCSLRVRFHPTDQGPFPATLSIPSNDPDTSIKNISLSGEGYGLNVWISKVDLANCPSTISVDVTVTDASNPLSTLTAAAFKLFQNNIQLQNVAVSNWQGFSPVTVVIALDASGSMSSIMPAVKAEASNFINQLQVGDYIATCKIGNDTNVIKLFPEASPFLIEATPAGKTDLINSGIYGLFNPTADTSALYDSLILAINRAAAPGTFPGKKALVIVSDGVDNASLTYSLDQVIAYAKQNGVKIFSVYYISPSLVQYARPQVMVRLANETGGQYYDATDADFASAFQKLLNVITNNYTITYTSSTCAGTISVRVDSGSLYGADTTTFP
jgi:VWFA-related protein